MLSVIIMGVVVLDVMAPAEGVNHKSTPIVFNVSQSSLSTNFLFLKKVSFFINFCLELRLHVRFCSAFLQSTTLP